MNLLSKKCIPCEGNVKPLSREQIAEYYVRQISSEWKLISENDIDKIKKHFEFINFKDTISFVNKVASLAESEGHHLNIFL